jgi:hypothetical protein
MNSPNSPFRLASYLTLSIIWLCACFLFGLNQWISLSRIAVFAIAGTTLLILVLSLVKDEQLYQEMVEMFFVMGIVAALVMLIAFLLQF